MTKAETPKLKRDWTGRKVRLRRDMETIAGAIFKAGEIMEVVKYHRGLILRAISSCSECKRNYRVQIKRIGLHDVELVD